MITWLAVLLAMAIVQTKDAPPIVRASVCLNTECSKSALIGYAPAVLRVTYSVPIHADNRRVGFGLYCSSGVEWGTVWSLDGAQEKVPQWVVMYRNVPAGECIALATVERVDGTILRGQSGTVLIQESR